MDDEIMTAVASALAGKAADAVAGSVQGAWGKLIRVIRGRLAREGSAAVLAQAQAGPPDEAKISQLFQVLERVAAADPGFAEEVRALWPQAQAELLAEAGGTLNISSGTVGGHLLQAQNIRVEGDLTLGAVTSPPP
jgi:hypothetical protein